MEYKSVDLAHLYNDNILFLKSVHLSSRDNPRHELRNMKLEGIEYAKILKQGKFKGKVLNVFNINSYFSDDLFNLILIAGIIIQIKVNHGNNYTF